MSYQTRLLPPAEWARLAETYAAPALPHLRESARVVVVEDATGAIVACHVLQPVLHAECLWVHPDHQKRGVVGGRLWRAVKQEAREHFAAAYLCTASASAEVDALLAHVGATPIDARFHMVPVGGR